MGRVGMWSKPGVQTPSFLLLVKTEVARHSFLCLGGQLGLYNFYSRYTLTSVAILGGGFSKAYLPGVLDLAVHIMGILVNLLRNFPVKALVTVQQNCSQQTPTTKLGWIQVPLSVLLAKPDRTL